ncbi:MAG: ATP synthase F0 subunit B [Parcubacteria group bacterium CG2_30_45_37]|nr:MAG: ATP synthase F0 subunit B [Parcubacteria group bacterium CG2_30_45_37]
MGSLIDTFHIDIRLLAAQAVNFAIVFLILYFFIFKPLSKVMADRSAKIAKSLADAEEIDRKLAEAENKYKVRLAEAKKEANLILDKVNRQAEENKQAMIIRAKEEIGQIINQEKQKMQVEKAATLKEIKKETAGLVIAAVEKVLGEKMDGKKDGEMIKQMIK